MSSSCPSVAWQWFTIRHGKHTGEGFCRHARRSISRTPMTKLCLMYFVAHRIACHTASLRSPLQHSGSMPLYPLWLCGHLHSRQGRLGANDRWGHQGGSDGAARRDRRLRNKFPTLEDRQFLQDLLHRNGAWAGAVGFAQSCTRIHAHSCTRRHAH